MIAVLAAALAAGVLLALLRADPSGATGGTAGATSAGAVTPRSDTVVSVDAADPALAGVDTELARRITDAQAAAANDGVVLTITSAKRSAEEQQALVDAAITRHGSHEEASKWVLPPEASGHVQGLAVDVGPTEGALWLGEHGLDFGLCRVYANEMWHFEMLPADEPACAPMHEDSSGGW